VINVIRSEWIKFRSVRSSVVLITSAGVLVAVVAFFVARDVNKHGRVGHLSDMTSGLPLALFLFGALGVQILGQEYRFSTIRPTFTAVPQRLRVLVAKLLVVTVATAAVTVIMLGICALIGSAMLDRYVIDGVDHRVILGTILFAMGWTALGMGVGAIVRQPIAGMLILLVEGFVLENIARGLFHSAGKWLPFNNGLQMTYRPDQGEGPNYLRSVLGGGIYFFIVVAIVWGVGAYLAQRRDA
jgi:ABC-2 type transport system permease protein